MNLKLSRIVLKRIALEYCMSRLAEYLEQLRKDMEGDAHFHALDGGYDPIEKLVCYDCGLSFPLDLVTEYIDKIDGGSVLLCDECYGKIRDKDSLEET